MKKGVLKNLVKSQENTFARVCRRLLCNFIKKETLAGRGAFL